MAYIVIGDSFVRFLYRYQQDNYNSNLYIKLAAGNRDVKIVEYGGWKVSNVQRYIQRSSQKADRIVVSVGGNDLERQPLETVVRNMIDLIKVLESKSDKYNSFLFCEVLPRINNRCRRYNAKVKEFNKIMKTNLKNNFWKHSGIIANKYGKDSIYLNKQGLKNYRRSMISALSFKNV